MPPLPFDVSGLYRPRAMWMIVAALVLGLAGCGEGPVVSVTPQELALSCPAGMQLIDATSFPSGPWHTPRLLGDESPPPPALDPDYARRHATLILVPAFCVDRFRAPDPAHRDMPESGFDATVTRAQAEAACRARGLRLCTVYEWELVCRGTKLTRFPYGSVYDPSHGHSAQSATPQRCQSSFGVYDQLGGEPEWVLGPLNVDKDNATALPTRMGGVLPGEDPLYNDCLMLRTDDMHRSAPAEGNNPPPALTTAAFRCCRDPLAKSQYILNYDK